MQSLLRCLRECANRSQSGQPIVQWGCSKYLRPALTVIPCAQRGKSSVAVVGTGPAGIYFVDRLKRLLPGSVSIDLFERLPTPFGLVRSGVAPDHPGTKNVINKFTDVCSAAGVRFIGNVTVGKDVSVCELQQHYCAVVLAHGAENDRHLDIENETSKGVLSAREFVNWYNGHPMFTGVGVPNMDSVDSVGIIGVGNVALDCARVLLRPIEDLQTTDIADHALSELRRSKIKSVHIIGRKGPFQSQFSGKELREILSLPNVSVTVHPDDYWPTATDMEQPQKAQKMFREMVNANGKLGTESPPRALHFHFLESPSKILVDGDNGQITALEVQAHEHSYNESGRQIQVATGEFRIRPMQLLLKSVGYRGSAMAGVPFNEARGVVPHRLGRVIDVHGSVIPGMYVTGWIKRGPQGIIGNNIMDAEQTARCVHQDFDSLSAGKPQGDVHQLLQDRGVEVVTWQGWQQIDAEERRRGEPQGRPRVKITNVQTMLEIAGKNSME